MQKKTRQATLTRTGTLRIHGRTSRRSMHRHLVVTIVGAVLLVGVEALKRSAAGLGPGESP